MRGRRGDSDGRGWYAELTDEGFEALQAAAPGHVTAVRSAVFDVLSARQQHALREAATLIAQNLRPGAVELT